MTNEKRNDDAWDDLCVKPHEASLQQGKREGHQAGLQAGFQDGQDLGLTKGLEIGLELGFIQGACREILDHQTQKQSKIVTTVQQLFLLIDDFPSPDTVFEEDQESTMNLAEKMQRIRAKFKVVTVQLGIPHFSLKQILSSPAADSTQPSATVEW